MSNQQVIDPTTQAKRLVVQMQTIWGGLNLIRPYQPFQNKLLVSKYTVTSETGQKLIQIELPDTVDQEAKDYIVRLLEKAKDWFGQQAHKVLQVAENPVAYGSLVTTERYPQHALTVIKAALHLYHIAKCHSEELAAAKITNDVALWIEDLGKIQKLTKDVAAPRHDTGSPERRGDSRERRGSDNPERRGDSRERRGSDSSEHRGSDWPKRAPRTGRKSRT